ncbi:hypothetical protein [Paenibacillus graminis]|uniref:hypothetical protein n=1 Tax=Paenibacillus graminis TaxID=189425 RepID=UPI002DBC661C|nr:hypothetical protein [Paenibacillus graminis]MEC0171899.1 hypothetical protein [Paenibacillus graminis]
MVVINTYIDELERTTIDLISIITTVSYEQLEQFSECRYQLVRKIEQNKEDLSEDAKKRLIKLKSYDLMILQKMDQFKIEASEWLLKQEMIKVQKTAYVTSYSAESILFDRKN